MSKCSVSSIDEKLKIMKVYATELSQSLLMRRNFPTQKILPNSTAALFLNRVRDIQDYRLFILFTIFCLGKKFSPYFPFHNVGRSALGTRHFLLNPFRPIEDTVHWSLILSIRGWRLPIEIPAPNNSGTDAVTNFLHINNWYSVRTRIQKILHPNTQIATQQKMSTQSFPTKYI